MTIHELDKIISSGVKSLKIEGRMRKPEYVIATVRAYREALDNVLSGTPFDLQERVTELLSVFNREYTKGYLLDEQPYNINNSNRPNHQGIEIGEVIAFNHGKTDIRLSGDLRVGDGIRIIGDSDFGDQVGRILIKNRQVDEAHKNDVATIDLPKKVDKGSKVLKTSDSKLESSLKVYLDENYGIVPLRAKLTAYVGEKLKLYIANERTGSLEFESDYIVVPAKNAIQTEEKLASQFSKFGNTSFFLAELEVETDGLGFIPNGVINELRRTGISAIEEAMLYRKPRRINDVHEQTSKPSLKEQEVKIFVKVENEEQYQVAVNCGVKDIASLMVRNKWKMSSNINNYLMLQRVWYDLPGIHEFSSVILRDIGTLDLGKDRTTVADSTFNVTNSLTLSTLFTHNVDRVCLSIESGLENSKRVVQSFNRKFGHQPNLELIAYGKPDLMISKYCPITKSEGIFKQNCNICSHNDYALVNEKQERFELIREGYCNLRVLHSKTINLIDYVEDIVSIGVKTIRLDFTTETKEEVKMVIKAFQNKINGKDFIMPDKKYTYGRFLR
jgi:putative protease